MKRLLALTQDPDDPATRYRLNLYIPFLRQAGVDVHSVAWPRKEQERLAVLETVSDHDSVIVQRRLIHTRHVKTLRKRARRLAYDFDDAVIYSDRAARRTWLLLDRVWKFRSMILECDAVTAGNAYLADLALRCGARGRIEIVPTVIDMTRYANRSGNETKPSGDPVLGWIGQQSTVAFLRKLRKPLQHLARTHPGLRLRTISNAHPHFPFAVAELRPWSEETEVENLSTIDVGLAPLTENAWSRGKCGLRLLQYLAASVPAVASPVGSQKDITALGAALAATTSSEWIRCIELLLNDASLRKELNSRGRQVLENQYAPAVWVPIVKAAWCGH